MEIKRILAKDARATADTTSLIINRIYKVITETAREGLTKLTWVVDGMSETLLHSIVKDLCDSGYEVIINYDDDNPEVVVELLIKW